MKYKLSILFLLFTTHLCAQDIITPDDVAKKNEINSIKLAGEAIYADTYQEVSADEAELAEAHRRSKDLLKAHVIEIFAKRLHMDKKDVQEIWSVLENRCENIIIKKGDLCRVFTYVMKNAIGASLSKNKGNEEVNKEVKEVAMVAPKPEPKPEPKVEPKVEVVSEVMVEPKVEKKVEVKPEPKVEPKPETKPEPKPEPKVEPKPEPKVEPKPEPAPAPAPVVAPASEVVVPALCQTMHAKGNMNDLMRYLNQEKRYQRLMFGNFNSMQYPSKCYVVIIDKSTRNIVSILDKGENERMNFITKQMDRYSNYRGGNYAAIFVQEY